ncbi:hypothetical protein DL93DRAFT_2234282 [Clavulina sp. PMI_390]|nr:hypothetical protein DL93DRAFT_2234282 [Clavulina sp. PMI_390]
MKQDGSRGRKLRGVNATALVKPRLFIKIRVPRKRDKHPDEQASHDALALNSDAGKTTRDEVLEAATGSGASKSVASAAENRELQGPNVAQVDRMEVQNAQVLNRKEGDRSERKKEILRLLAAPRRPLAYVEVSTIRDFLRNRDNQEGNITAVEAME